MKCKGWKQILSFNYVQYVKSKSFIASTIIIAAVFALIMAAINIVPAIIAGGSFGKDEESSPVSDIYILNDTEFPTFDFSYFEDEGIKCSELSKDDFEAKSDEISKSENPQVAVKLSSVKDDEGKTQEIQVDVYRPENKNIVSKSQGEDIGYACADLMKQSVFLSLGVGKEDLYLTDLSAEINVQVFGDETSSLVKELVGALVPMFSALIMFCFIVSYAQLIAQSVAQEKTSRVIELLITSVRPLAIIVGKVLAMLLIAITQVAVIGAVSGIAFAVTMPFSLAAAGGQMIEGATAAIGEAAAAATEGGSFVEELTAALPGLFNPLSLVAIIITFILGFLFYALLAGLVGAGVSRIEDLAASLQPLMLVAMVGFFLSYFSSAFNADSDGEGNIVMVISRFIPISSPFALPAPILTGEMSAPQILIAMFFLALLTVLMAMLVAKVYENIIFYSGSPLKFNQILKMAKSK